MECRNGCGKETSGRSAYCSDKCKVAYNRNKSVTPESVTIVRNVTLNSKSVTEEGKSVTPTLDTGVETGNVTEKHGETLSGEPEQNSDRVSGLTAKQLYLAIHNYPQDTWTVSPEYKELMRRLHAMTIEELEVGGYNIPCWKYTEAA